MASFRFHVAVAALALPGLLPFACSTPSAPPEAGPIPLVRAPRADGGFSPVALARPVPSPKPSPLSASARAAKDAGLKAWLKARAAGSAAPAAAAPGAVQAHASVGQSPASNPWWTEQ